MKSSSLHHSGKGATHTMVSKKSQRLQGTPTYSWLVSDLEFIQIGAGLSQAKSIMFMLSSANVLMFYNQFIESTSEEKKKKWRILEAVILKILCMRCSSFFS